jgi:hypothetical protein
MGLIETLRRWVDGEDGEDALSRAAVEQAKPRRQAEEFIALIARSIGEVMHNEAVPVPPDQIVIPPEYIVFLSDDDDRDWQGAKRRALEQGLYHVLAEHAKDLAGKTKLATTSFSVELRVDGTLPKGEVRVQHSWEESLNANKTSIIPRSKNKSQIPATPLDTNQGIPKSEKQKSESLTSVEADPSQLAPTVLGTELNLTPAKTADETTRVMPRSGSEANLDSEATRVHKRELYRVEIWRNNQRQAVLPVFQAEISIGRKSNKIVSDIMLEDDPEVSRPHIILRRDSDGRFWVVHKGKNPTIVNGRQIPADEPSPLSPGEPILICSYMIRVQ